MEKHYLNLINKKNMVDPMYQKLLESKVITSESFNYQNYKNKQIKYFKSTIMI